MEDMLSYISPAWVLAFVLAAINVFVFHVALVEDGHSAVYFAPFGIFGFSIGNFLAWLVGSPLPMMGDVHVIEASIGAWVVLTLANTR
ncbi:MAG: hypothetical protein HY332_07740 [Chloroflexi bacterium]|nr:hypothetical protein [Chloroflexota bacterium]